MTSSEVMMSSKETAMNTRVKYPEIFQLSAEEKWELAVDLWDDVTGSPPAFALSPGVKAELDRRREEFLRDPSTAVSVDETFDELMNHSRITPTKT